MLTTDSGFHVGDKAKEFKEPQDPDSEDRSHASSSYQTPEPRDTGTDNELSGIPWGSLSMRHVISKSQAERNIGRSESVLQTLPDPPGNADGYLELGTMNLSGGSVLDQFAKNEQYSYVDLNYYDYDGNIYTPAMSNNHPQYK